MASRDGRTPHASSSAASKETISPSFARHAPHGTNGGHFYNEREEHDREREYRPNGGTSNLRQAYAHSRARDSDEHRSRIAPSYSHDYRRQEEHSRAYDDAYRGYDEREREREHASASASANASMQVDGPSPPRAAAAEHAREDRSPSAPVSARPSMSISSILNNDDAPPPPRRSRPPSLQGQAGASVSPAAVSTPLPPAIMLTPSKHATPLPPPISVAGAVPPSGPVPSVLAEHVPMDVDDKSNASIAPAPPQDADSDDDVPLAGAGAAAAVQAEPAPSAKSAKAGGSKKGKARASTGGGSKKRKSNAGVEDAAVEEAGAAADDVDDLAPPVNGKGKARGSDDEYQPSRSRKRASKGGAEAVNGSSKGKSPLLASVPLPDDAGKEDAPAAKRKKVRIKTKHDSDLEAEDNKPLWQPALKRYRSDAHKRREALDLAYGLLEDEQDERVAKTLASGYLLRYDAILREEAKEAAAEERRLELLRAKEAKRQEKKDKERRERELLQGSKGKGKESSEARKQRERREKAIEDELLDTLVADPPAKWKRKSRAKPRPSAAEGADEDEQHGADSSEDEVPLASRLPGSEEPPAKGGKSKKRRKSAAGNDSIVPNSEGEDDSEDDAPLARGDRDTSILDVESALGSRMPSPEPTAGGEEPGIGCDENGYVIIDTRRAKALEEAHRKIWTAIARKEIPKVNRTVQLSHSNRTTYWRRISQVVQREARRAVARNTKTVKDQQIRARKVMREMLVFWRRNEKEERELRKKAEKEAVERAKKEEEMREAKRQARKLNFLITQTELYSHFVGSKLKTDEAEESEETAGSSKIIDPTAAPGDVPPVVPGISATPAVDADGNLKEIDFDDEDESNLRAHAMRNAEEAVNAAKAKAVAFDQKAAEERRRNEAAAAGISLPEDSTGGKRIEEKDLGKAFDSDDMNFLNPTSMGAMNLKQPKMLTCQLKEYQLKGLNWLANLYEQGINGILADEMGLGKTVQSISLMAYLAEVHDIWGPFLVIAPASTLHNWQQEISRFVPSLKALPYWGNVKDRAVLRKFWNKKQMAYNKDAPFHVLVTSYQLVVSDEKYFQRVKWQYMILDEAQAIKSSSSARWKTLLGFNCRNRLLLTGTPVQNSMQELWALLHFIMPSLFDSHDEFSEWFSKDIESHAENKGTLNEHQLKRLHMILKPFMLRRIKKNVQNELGEKIEIDLFCDMSARQRALYRGLRAHMSIAELMDKATNNDEAGLKSLMNLVMQFRKVCNHPELFERADVEAPLAFAESAQSGSLAREGDSLFCPYSTTNPIKLEVPKIMSEDSGILSVPGPNSRAGFDTHYLQNLFNIWRPHHVAESLKGSSTFSALPLLGLSPADASDAFHGSTIVNILHHTARESRLQEHGTLLFDDDFAAASIRPFGYVRKPLPSITDAIVEKGVLPMDGIAHDARVHSVLAAPSKRALVKPAVAPPIAAVSSNRAFTMLQEGLLSDPLSSAALFGLPGQNADVPQALDRLQKVLPDLPPRGLLAASSEDQLPASGMQVPQMNKLIVDSTKLARLDSLLRELKAGGHRVLIYFQMTKMIDLMEEYLIYRQYKYLRLDGASKISDRRDMVTDWQTKPELFIFLLSTRAGGLGINLTAADTVIFYDHDWNPSNDSQAMDRAHRLGQTKQVTVYRLITKGTIDERIVKLARNKKEVQDIVVGNKAYSETGMARPQEIVSLLLDDDELAESMLRRKHAEEQAQMQAKVDSANAMHAKRKLKLSKAAAAAEEAKKAKSANIWELEDDEDDFFGAKPPGRGADEDTPAANSPAAAEKPSKKRKSTGGKSGNAADGAAPKKKSKKAAAGADAAETGDGTPAKPRARSSSGAGRDRSHRKKSAEELGGVEATQGEELQ